MCYYVKHPLDSCGLLHDYGIVSRRLFATYSCKQLIKIGILKKQQCVDNWSTYGTWLVIQSDGGVLLEHR